MPLKHVLMRSVKCWILICEDDDEIHEDALFDDEKPHDKEESEQPIEAKEESKPLLDGMLCFPDSDDKEQVTQPPTKKAKVAIRNKDSVAVDSDLAEDKEFFESWGIFHFSDNEEETKLKSSETTKGKKGVWTRNDCVEQGIQPEISLEATKTKPSKPRKPRSKSKTEKGTSNSQTEGRDGSQSTS